MEELQKSFHLSPNGFIEAPAGFGKTYLILDTISKYSGEKQLILTHTVAGVAVLRARLADHGMTYEDVAIDTIAGWCQRYVLSFPGIAGADLEILRAQDPAVYWDHIYDTFTNLLKNTNIKDIIRFSFGGIYVDEYQDCSKLQHQLIVELAKVLPVRILGDPLQGIFNFRTGQMVDWSQVEEVFTPIGVLTTPHRWNKVGNPAYGEWLKEVREKLIAEGEIDLGAAPDCVEVVILSGNPGDDQMLILSKARENLSTNHRRLIIGDKQNTASKALVVKLSRPRYRLIESIYSRDIKELRECIQKLDSTGKDSDLALFWLLTKYYSGIPANIKQAAKRIAASQGSNSQNIIVKALKNLHEKFTVDEAYKLIEAIETTVKVSCHRTQPVFILEMTLTGVKEGRHPTLYAALEAAIASIGRRGRVIPKYGIGSTLLVKGLEVEEVILLNAHNLAKNDLYVALSRATKRITIFTNSHKLNPG